MGEVFEKIAISLGVIVAGSFVLGSVVMSTANINGGNNGQVQVQQIDETERVATETKKETVPFDTKIIDDETVEYGKTVVKTEGVNGEKTYTYRVTYKGKKEVSRESVKEEITKQPVTEVIAKGTKIVWSCRDVTSYDRNLNNDNFCTSNTGEQRYVGDCAAVDLDPDYHPGQGGVSYYNGCPNY